METILKIKKLWIVTGLQMKQFCGPQDSFPYSRSQSFSGKTGGLGRKPNSKTICIIQPSYLFQKHLLNISNMLFLRLKRKTKYGKPDMLVDFCFSCASVFEGCLGCGGPPSVKVGSRWFAPFTFLCWLWLIFFSWCLQRCENPQPSPQAHSHKRLLHPYCHLVYDCGTICLVFSHPFITRSPCRKLNWQLIFKAREILMWDGRATKN